MQTLNLNISLQGNQTRSSHSVIHQRIWISQFIWRHKYYVFGGAHFKFKGPEVFQVPRTQLPNNEKKIVLQNQHVDDFCEFRDLCQRSMCKDHSSSVVESIVSRDAPKWKFLAKTEKWGNQGQKPKHWKKLLCQLLVPLHLCLWLSTNFIKIKALQFKE